MSAGKRISLCAFALVLVATPLGGRVKEPTLKELTHVSDYIVVGRVLNVRKIADKKIAELQVTEVWKGSLKVSTVHFLAEPTWICDSSWADAGEEGVYFLSRPHGAGAQPLSPQLPRPYFYIAWSGRGRMLTRRSGGEILVDSWFRDTPLRAEMTVPRQNPKDTSIRSLSLTNLRTLISNFQESAKRKMG